MTKTQSQRILSFWRANPNVRPKEAARRLNLPSATVRGRLSDARKKGFKIPLFTHKRTASRVVQRRERPRDVSSYRKIVKVGGSDRDERPTKLFAITYEKNKTSRRNELEDAIFEYISENGIFIGDNSFGYEIQSGNGSPEYPEIEVGEE